MFVRRCSPRPGADMPYCSPSRESVLQSMIARKDALTLQLMEASQQHQTALLLNRLKLPEYSQ